MKSSFLKFLILFVFISFIIQKIQNNIELKVSEKQSQVDIKQNQEIEKLNIKINDSIKKYKECEGEKKICISDKAKCQTQLEICKDLCKK